MVTVCLVKTTRQSLSQKGAIPRRLCWKPGITWPVDGRLEGMWGRASWQSADETMGCPDAVPTLTGGALGFKLVFGAEGIRYISLAPESTIADSDDLRARRLATLRVHRAAVRLDSLVGPNGCSAMVERKTLFWGWDYS